MVAYGMTPAQKHHWLLEIARDSFRSGNPMKFSNYADEDFNRIVAGIAGHVHGTTFAVSVLKKYRVHCIVKQVAY